jgi:hypothetical protein
VPGWDPAGRGAGPREPLLRLAVAPMRLTTMKACRRSDLAQLISAIWSRGAVGVWLSLALLGSLVIAAPALASYYHG